MRKQISMIAAAALFTLGMYLFAADEITVNGLLKLSNGEMQLQRNIASQVIDQQSQSMSYTIQPVTTGTHQPLVVYGGVITNGITWFRNLTTNTTRYVEIGTQGASTNFIPVLRLHASDITITRMHPTNTIYLRATGGPVNLEAWINAN